MRYGMGVMKNISKILHKSDPEGWRRGRDSAILILVRKGGEDMPSTYAHRRFGADVLVQLPRELREKITPYRSLYDWACTGLI